MTDEVNPLVMHPTKGLECMASGRFLDSYPEFELMPEGFIPSVIKVTPGLLEEARRRYPIGTVIKTITTGIERKVIASPRKWSQESIAATADMDDVFLYHDQKWAEIILSVATVENQYEIY